MSGGADRTTSMPGRGKGLVFACALIALLSQAAMAARDPSVELSGGLTQIRLNTHVLGDLGVTLHESEASLGSGETDDLGTGEFPILEMSVLGLSLPGGSYRGPVSGHLAHRGGIELRWDGDRVSLVDFELHPAMPPDVFELRAADGSVIFLLDNPHPQRSQDGREFLLLDMDLRLSDPLAARLRRPDLAGMAVGEAHVRTRFLEPESAAGLPDGATCVADFSGAVDVRLETMSSVAETFHDIERVALAPSVELMNVGVADVPWFRSIAPDGNPPLDVVGEHPFLVMSLYRTLNDRIEQIGRSDVKHAFFSGNTGPCDCQADQVLFNDCTDVYGASTNSHRKFLAPRDEVEASTGLWTRIGSHFDGPPPDDFRGHDEPDHGDQFEHRLSAAVADLEQPGAEYRVEAWYLVKDDVDISNSMGHRVVAPTFDGTWAFPFADLGLTRGSVLDSWIDPLAPPPHSSNVSITTTPDEGQLQLAAKASILPGGIYHYEYALMNFDFDRQIDRFTVPLPPGAPEPPVVQKVWFGDGDSLTANDWTVSVSAAEISWEAPGGKGLDWGTLFSFSFEVNAEPDGLETSLEALEAGFPDTFAVSAVGPLTLIPATQVEVSIAGSGAGDVSSLPVGIDCGEDCSEIFSAGTVLGLFATATSGSAFVHWEEGSTSVSQDLAYGFEAEEDRDLVAVFETCVADVELAAEVVTQPTVFHACDSIRASDGFEVASEVVFRVGKHVALGDGFSVTTGAKFRAEIVAGQSATPLE